MPVASFPDGASPYKALDIAGNVWEWTGSLWGEAQGKADFGYPYDPSDGRENLAAPDDVLRVMRGGSFQDRNARSVTCTVRIGGKPADAQPYIGFRVALTP
jgi:formylglycine-generating enzyme required for sulfatase activity